MNILSFDKIAYKYYNKYGIAVQQFTYNPYTHIYTIKFRKYLVKKTYTWSQIKKVLTDADLIEIFEAAKQALVDETSQSFNGI